MKPSAEWDSITPVPIKQLYSSILEGQLEVELPLVNKLAPERAVELGYVVAMSIHHHMEFQVQP